MTSSLSRLAAGLFLLSLTGCGSGLAGIVSSSGSSSSGSNAPSSISAFTVVQSRLTPATLRFRTIDAEADPVAVEIFFQRGGGAPESITQLAGRPNPDSYASSGAGVDHVVEWNFTSEPALADVSDGSFAGEVTVFATLLGGVQEAVPGASDISGLGNDPPVVADPTPPSGAEVDGVAPVTFTLADSSSDTVDVLVEFALDDGSEPAWQLATPGGLDTNPIPSVATTPTPTGQTFFWDTDIDVPGVASDVRLRFTALDDVGPGQPAETPLFRVDNNLEPLVEIFEGALLLNPDEQRGIPIPFTVSDAEGDDVRVVFQWRRAGDAYPELPTTRTELEALLTDPVLRTERNVCTELPSTEGGTATPLGPNTLRLPELTTSAPLLLTSGVEGRELELLRFANVLAPVFPDQVPVPWVQYVDALPIGDGRRALVLDQATPDSWSLLQVELVTGEVECTLVASGNGVASALAPEIGTDNWPAKIESVLVASHVNETWKVERVALQACPGPSVVTTFVSADGTTELGQIRGLASLGRHAALITVGSSLIRIEGLGVQRQTTLMDDLATPWGVARDIVRPNRVFVAEHSAATPEGEGRILSVDIATFARETVTLTSYGPVDARVNRPRGLALEQSGDRLLVCCDGSKSGTYALRTVDLLDRGRVAAVGDELTVPLWNVATGRHGLRLASAADGFRLFAAGGLEQRRRIEAYDALTGTVTVNATGAPALDRQRSWRMTSSVLRGRSSGRRGMFTWDSRDALKGRVFFRATAYDNEAGPSDESGAAKDIVDLAFEPLIFGSSPFVDGPESVIAVDLDDDGDLDVVSANEISDNLTVFFQEARDVYSETPLVLGDSSVTDAPGEVIAADLDGDGDLELISANEQSDTITAFYQTAPGVFDPAPLILGGLDTTERPTSVIAVDLDRDGDLDLVSVNQFSDNLALFLQTDGEFVNEPELLVVGEFDPRPVDVEAGDVDGDGDVDLVTTELVNRSVVVFKREADGTYTRTEIEPFATTRPRELALGDINRDGQMDIVFSDTGFRAILLPSLLFLVEPVSIVREAVAVANVDRDGTLDIVGGSRDSDVLALYRDPSGQGDPLLKQRVVGDDSTTDAPLTIAAADLDRSGTTDVITASYVGDHLTAFRQRAPGDFPGQPTDSLSLFSDATSLQVADMDGDGNLDVLSSITFFQDSPGLFAGATGGLPIGSSEDEDLIVADVDGDGDTDVFVAQGVFGALRFLRRDETGAFDVIDLREPGAGVDPWAMALADLDQDGDPDLAVANRAGNNLGVYFQSEPGVFPEPPFVPLLLGERSITKAPTDIAAADLDQDGDNDLITANRDNLAIFFQETPGTFGTPLLLFGDPYVDRPVSIVTADIDADGDIDIVTANRLSDNLTLFLQEAPGVFSDPPIPIEDPTTVDRPRSVVAADVDGDGDLDLVTAGSESSTVKVYFQSSPGLFAGPPRVLGDATITALAREVAAVDLDRDGEIDIVTGSIEGDPKTSGGDLTIFWGGR